MIDHISAALKEAQSALSALLANEAALTSINQAGDILAKAFQEKNLVMSCGNGGSMCDAMHFAEELSGRFRKDRPSLGAISLSDPSHMSCVGNDYGYEHVFSRQVEGLGKKGDVLLAISTSGTSKNVVAAAQSAAKNGMHVIALTGRDNTPLEEIATVCINTPSGAPYADRVQELHIKCIHILIELVERKLFNSEY